MRITLIDYTGKDNHLFMYDQGRGEYAARLLAYTKNTRLTQGDETRNRYFSMPWKDIEPELVEVANTIRSSWEFVDYTFEIVGVTRAFVQQLTRTRVGVSFAVQTLRLTDMADFDTTVPETVVDRGGTSEWAQVVSRIREGYKMLRSIGVPAEDARGLLPLNTQTNLIFKINLRALADMVPKRQSLRAQSEYQLFAAELVRLVEGAHPWASLFLRPARTYTPALDALLRAVLGGKSLGERPDVARALKEIDGMKETWG